MPHQTLEKNLHLDIGGKWLELSYHGNIHQEGSSWIYAPSQRILMVVIHKRYLHDIVTLIEQNHERSEHALYRR